jgi:hypothetical protein
VEEPVGQRAFAVVDVGDDAEIPDAFHAVRLKRENTADDGGLVQGVCVREFPCNDLAPEAVSSSKSGAIERRRLRDIY